MMQISQLTKDQRVKEIITEINKKTSNSMSFTPFQSVIEPLTLIQIVESIEDRIYFISESPSFELNGRNWTCQQYKCDTIEDFKSLMDNHPNEFFVIYNIMLTNGVVSNARHPQAPGISQNQSYMIRGIFIEDPSIKREQIINQILNEE
jgi:hypothetical protein